MKQSFKKSVVFLLAILALTFSALGVTPAYAAGTCYVNASASGANDGTSWADAYTDLQSAIADTCTEIWVAAGVYKPTTYVNSSSLNISFQLENGVAIYGGFPNTGDPGMGERDFTTNVTILSGDLTGNDPNGDGNFITEVANEGNTNIANWNSYHVVTGATGATLDGFTITASMAWNYNYGGGMYNNNASPTLANLKFIGNGAQNGGGGMYNSYSNPTLTNVTFSGNYSANGAGIYNDNGSPILTNVTFSGNNGTAIGNWRSNPTLTNVVFNANVLGMNNDQSSPVLSNVVFIGVAYQTSDCGGMINSTSNPVLSNVTFSGHNGWYGGAMCNSNSSPILTNVTFSNNGTGLAGVGGSMKNVSGSNPLLKNVIMANSGDKGDCTGSVNASSSNNLFQSTTACGLADGANGNIVGKAAVLGTLGDYGGTTQTIPLLPGSPAIDAGNDTACAAAVGSPNYGAGGVDQRGVIRPQGGTCDIGAFESHGFTLGSLTGDNQEMAVNFDFMNPIGLTVTANDAREPIDGGKVTFTFPASGASAALTGNPATAGADGVTTSVYLTANDTAGSYNVTANANGAASVDFTMTNTAAATITVESSADGTPANAGNCPGAGCRLRDAIAAANSGDVIDFAAGLSGQTINLVEQLVVDEHLTIDGSALASPVIINGQGSTRVFQFTGNYTRNLTGLTISGGQAPGLGGQGGGVHNDNGELNVTNCTFSGNNMDNGGEGGGIYNASGIVTVTGCTFSNNNIDNGSEGKGGGIYNAGGTVNVTNSVFSDNAVFAVQGGIGAGIFSLGGILNVTDSTFSNNVADNGSAIIAFDRLNVTNSTFVNNNGAYAVHFGTAQYPNTETMVVLNSTFVNNGGAVRSAKDATIKNSTFSGNGDGFHRFSGQAYIYNNIFVGSACSGGILTDAFNNQWDTGSCGVGTLSSTILLGTLGNYGGATQTIPLLPGSSAIDACNPAYGVSGEDQRGESYAGTCDLGAFESQGFTLTPTGGSGQSAPINTAFSSPLTLNVTSGFGEPVAGGKVTFTPPASGASAVITGSPATIDSSGNASVTAAANSTAGGPYNVVASANGAASVNFALTNTGVNHTATFNVNGGTGSMSPQTANSPTALNLNAFTRTGYAFSGWNTAANGSGTPYADGASYSFAADITLYAQWAVLHTVIFDANGGAGSMSPQTAGAPAALTSNTFTRTGYAFSGWNTAANGSVTPYADGATYSFAADVTLYAQWTPVSNALHFDGVNDYVNLGDPSALRFDGAGPFTIETWFKKSASVRGVIFAKLSSTAPNTGYELRSEPNGSIVFSIINTYPTNLLSVYTDNTFNDTNWHHVAVTYNGSKNASGVNIYVDGVSQSLTASYNSLTGSASTTIPALIGVRAGGWSPFSGTIDEVRIWNVVRSGTEIQANLYNEIASQSGLVALYHFDQGIPGGNNLSVTTALDDSGNALNGALNSFALTGATSNWVAGHHHIVTFDANGGSGSMSNQVNYLPAALTLNTFTRTGYSFSGWNTAANGSGTPYADGATYSFAANITLYAQWTANTYTVTFDGNGGSGSMSPQTANVPTALTLNTFTRSGYSFAGWNILANGSGTSYANGATYDFSADVTLYAQWTVANLTVTFGSSGAQDGWILESGENTNKGGTMNSTTTTFRLGDDAAKRQYRSVLSFATGASLPDNAVITKVTLKVRKQGITGGGNPLTMFQGFMVDIKKGFFGTAALQTSDFQATASKAYGPFNPALTGGWYSLNLTTGKAYVNKLSTLSGLTQIRLRFKLDDNNNTVANYLSLYSGNAPTASRPQLIIEYHLP